MYLALCYARTFVGLVKYCAQRILYVPLIICSACGSKSRFHGKDAVRIGYKSRYETNTLFQNIFYHVTKGIIYSVSFIDEHSSIPEQESGNMCSRTLTYIFIFSSSLKRMMVKVLYRLQRTQNHSRYS